MKELVSAEQALKGLQDVKNYCEQHEGCSDCKLYAWCTDNIGGHDDVMWYPCNWEI